VTIQIYEGLVSLKPEELRSLRRWRRAGSRRTPVRHGRSRFATTSKFTDGTPFNAAAVCANFNRWYNFTGSFQNPSATYYWQTVFGGFKKYDPKSGAPKGSLFKSCAKRTAPRASRST